MGTNKELDVSGQQKALEEVLARHTKDEQFAFDCVAGLVESAIEIRREAGTEGMSARFSGNIDGVPYSVYLGPEKKEE